jgi:trimeric autotransporter adhesin
VPHHGQGQAAYSKYSLLENYMGKILGTAGKLRDCLQIWLALLFAVASVNAAEHHGKVVFNGFGVPGAVVTASRDDQKYSTITDDRGGYAFPDLPDGIWTIQIEMQAFAAIRQDVTIEPGAAAGLWALKLLSIDQIQGLKTLPPSPASPPPPAAGTASAASPTKNTNSPRGIPSSSTNTQTPFHRTEVNATSASPSPTEMDVLSTTQGALGDQSDLSQRAADGLLISGSANNSANSSSPQNRAFGNSRNFIGSRYNGAVSFNINNSALDARPYSLAGINTPKRGYNNVGGTFLLSGPLRIPYLVRNGPRFTVGYSFTRNRDVQTLTGLVPTIAERKGDLSQAPGRIFDPANNLSFDNNQIPDYRISRQANSLLNLYPLPNFTGSAQYNYQVPAESANHLDSIFAIMDKTVRNKNQLSGTFSLQRSRTDNQTLFGFLDAARSLSGSLSMNWQRSFTKSLYLGFGYQFRRQSNRSIPFFENRENVSGLAGIMGNDQEAVNWGPPALIFSQGLSSLYDALPSSTHNQASVLTVSGSWIRGDHNVSFGAEYHRQQDNRLAQQDPRGSFRFNGASTLGPSSQDIALAGARNDFAGFLLGIPDTISIAFGNADKYFRSSSYNAFIADDWRVSRSFTVNVGVRWEYWSPITELHGRLVNLDIAPGYSAVAPVVANHPVGLLTGANYPDSLLHPNKLAFQPRIGIAWKPIATSSLVVKSGYGIYYNSSPYQSIAEQMAQQSPLSKSLSLQNSAADPLTLASGFNASPNTATNTFAVDPNLRIGYVHIWQLSIQIDLPGALQFTAMYQGTRGRHALQETLPNSYPAGSANPCQSCPSGFRYMSSNGTSNLEAATLQLRRRLHNGFTANMKYKFSKSIDDAAPGTSGTSGVFIAQDWRNRGAERALSNFDQRHAGSLEFQYTTGSKSGMLLKGWRRTLLKEWTISSQINAASGLPQTPVFSLTISGTGVTGPMRPDLTGADIYKAPPGLHLNPAGYKAPVPGYWGNAGRNSITGPSQFALSASVGRTFHVSNRTRINLNISANNALNYAAFTSWDATLGSSQFGLPTGPKPMRSMHTSVRWSF